MIIHCDCNIFRQTFNNPKFREGVSCPFCTTTPWHTLWCWPIVLQCVVPSAPPANIQATMVDNTTMYLTWEPPPPHSLNGPLLGYKVQTHTQFSSVHFSLYTLQKNFRGLFHKKRWVFSRALNCLRLPYYHSLSVHCLAKCCWTNRHCNVSFFAIFLSLYILSLFHVRW